METVAPSLRCTWQTHLDVIGPWSWLGNEGLYTRRRMYPGPSRTSLLRSSIASNRGVAISNIPVSPDGQVTGGFFYNTFVTARHQFAHPVNFLFSRAERKFGSWVVCGLSGNSSSSFGEEGKLSLDASSGDGGARGNGGNGRWGSSGGGGDGAHDDDGDAKSLKNSDEYGPILRAEDVERVLTERGITLPPEMMTTAIAVGIPSFLLERYIDLQGAMWPLGPAIQVSGLLRNRMLADPGFLFKVFTEVAIDSCCATFAEVQKRGNDFWHEFEFYMSDLLVGIALDVALVGMLAPVVRLGGKPTTAKGWRGQLVHFIGALPNSCFEAASPGRTFSLGQRITCVFFKAAQYAVVGFGCGIIGQGIANEIMTLKRKSGKMEDDQVAVPPLVKSAAVWATFMAVSSNTRYQIINGLERVVESSAVAKRVPQLAMAFTVAIRFANNIYGGMQFIDWARLAGIQ